MIAEVRSEAEEEEEEETDSFVFGGCCGLTSDSPAAALPLLSLTCKMRTSPNKFSRLML